MKRSVYAGMMALLGTSAAAFEMPADEAAAQFVTSNIISTFYHELGHALIDVLQLPVLGREEDAADTLAAVLTHHIWEEESATQIIYDTAQAYALAASEAEAEGWDVPYWDTHSLDQQRYYNLVCLFYGAEPDLRSDIATELELPDERVESCPEEYELADGSWSAMLDGLEPGPKAKGLKLREGDEQTAIGKILAGEIATINENYGLPEEIVVKVAACDEANAYYLAEDRTITICTEYATEMQRLFEMGKS